MVFFTLLFDDYTLAQVSININDTVPAASAMLDISSTDRGLLIPRMTETQRNQIINAATGLMVYQLDADSGFYYWSGGTWLHLTGGVINMTASTIPKWDGTKLVNSAICEVNGNVGIGTTTSPAAKLDIHGPIRIQDGNQATGKVLTSGTDGTASWQSLGSSNITAGTGLSWNGNTLNSTWTKTGNDIYNNNTGNVGIGTSAPTAPLDVDGKIRGRAIYNAMNGILSSTTATSYVADANQLTLLVDSGDVVFAVLEGVFWNTAAGNGVIAYIDKASTSVNAINASYSYIMTNANAYTNYSGCTQTFFRVQETGPLKLCMWWRALGGGTANIRYGALKAWVIGKD